MHVSRIIRTSLERLYAYGSGLRVDRPGVPGTLSAMPTLEIPQPATPDQPIVPDSPTVPADPTPARETPDTPTGPDAPAPDDPMPPQPDGPDVPNP
jgi:hypothetical protein